MIALQYHRSTKHDFDRFAPSAGYLDWATQPDPFRRYEGAGLVALPREPAAPEVPYAALFDGSAPAAPFNLHSFGDLLRCSLGLSAWKRAGQSRWALRVNPSSGNLHPTEGYLIHDGRIAHYAPREHALEERAVLPPAAWEAFSGGRRGALVALTSIHWREAWKYGVRAFRYCQHDAGHAIGALRLAAAMLGWRLVLLPRWSSADLAVLLGLGEGDGAEPEEPECVAVITPDDTAPWGDAAPGALVEAARAARWLGQPNSLSPRTVPWPLIDEVTLSTRYPGAGAAALPSPADTRLVSATSDRPLARAILLQRRSAVAFDGRSTLARESFLAMLRRLQPGAAPWDAIDWPPQVHLALFVHRVDGLLPGLYVWLRDTGVKEEWRASMRPEFIWEPVPDGADGAGGTRLHFLLPYDMTWPANRVSCDQDIAADGFFSLGMIARFEPALRERGEWFYRRLFWECGLIGQVLYLEAEAAGARSTGIGCYYDDPVHGMLGLSGEAWQSLYHFSMGQPVDDPRITSEPGYPWELSSPTPAR